jgi:hypothetical protein
MSAEERIVEAETTIAELKSYFKPELWEKFLVIMKEGKTAKFSVVKIVFADMRVDSLRMEKIVK